MWKIGSEQDARNISKKVDPGNLYLFCQDNYIAVMKAWNFTKTYNERAIYKNNIFFIAIVKIF
jgi:hypothetical protein